VRLESDLNVFFAFPHPTDKFCTQRLGIDAKKICRKVQNFNKNMAVIKTSPLLLALELKTASYFSV